MTQVSILLVALLLQAPASTRDDSATPVQDPIHIDSGQVSGEPIGDSLRVYRGIPFAAPPVGDLRWKPPAPVSPWDGVRECTSNSPICPQPAAAMLGPERATKGQQSEDCLYLNVWTGATHGDARLPVMVWIHGGGHTTGSGSKRMYDGTNLARKGVVLVTINYRLGPFGYLAHPLLSAESPHGVSGNYGLLDQIAALEWVRRNILRFGGDPSNVTIFGESAGAASVSRLMVSPLAEGLFHRAIAQSGGPMGHNRHLREERNGQESAEAMGERMALTLGCRAAEDPLTELRALPAEEILGASRLAVGLFSRGDRYGPIVDGWSIPDDPARLWREGKMHDVPFMAGSNADEGTMFQKNLPVRRSLGYRLLLKSRFGDRAGEVESCFPADTKNEVAQAINKLTTVSAFAAPARAMVRAMEQKQSSGYLYHFTRVPDTSLRDAGAFHGLEIAYAFGNIRRFGGFDDSDLELADIMSNCWVRFARTGNPNGEGLPAWPPHHRQSDLHMEFGDSPRVGEGLYREAIDLLEEIGQSQ